MVVGAALALGVSSVQAADFPGAQALAVKNACFGCHAIERKVVGPGFAQVAERYKGDAGAEAKLIKKVQRGGSGVWGQLPMPSHPNLSDADTKLIVEWILAGGPGVAAER
jgi:cytochrome c